MTTRWGILATGNIARTFARAVDQSANGTLAAVGSRSEKGAADFAAAFAGSKLNLHASYTGLIEDPDVDAVYIATPHPQHAEWAIRALEAGKSVLVEKPMGLNHAECMAITTAAARLGRFAMEAYMYLLHPQTQKCLELIADGAIGDIRHIDASFGFQVPVDPASRLFAPALGGGAILDIGGYPMSIARRIANSEPASISAETRLSDTGVDEIAAALVKFDNGITANLTVATTLELANTVRISGTAGHIVLDQPWLPEEQWSLLLTRGATAEKIAGTSQPLYVIEAEHAADHIQANALESPAITWQESLLNNAALDAWRQVAGITYPAEQAASMTPLAIPAARTGLETAALAGLDKPLSRLVMGCDNQPSYAHASVVWDDYVAAGGNVFDTAHIYGGGSMETLLGDWQRARGLREEIVIIGKGAHTPDNFPDRVRRQLDESLSRLQTDYVDIYFLHRDNAELPAGEFIDALNEELRAGRIKVLGASNWTLERIREANAYAAANGLQGFTAISNNFSLARMIDPVWPGVESASDDEFRTFLEDTKLALFPWSAQARGFFTPWAEAVLAASEDEQVQLTSAQPTVAELKRVWFSDENLERRRRAAELAEARGVETINIALAYVLRQPFPTFPLIGPRSLHETASSMAGLDVTLSSDELSWLDLRDQS